MRLQMGRIDHQRIRLAALGRQCGKNAVKDHHTAPADKPVVDRLVRAIVRRGITPAQAVADHKDDAADDAPVIDPGNPMRQWKIRLESGASAPPDNQIKSLMAAPLATTNATNSTP